MKQPSEVIPTSSNDESNVITNSMLDISTKFVSLNLSARSEQDIDDQIKRTRRYIPETKDLIWMVTREYEEYLEKHSLDPIPTSTEYYAEIDRLTKIKKLIDLQLEAELTRAELSEIFKKRNRLPYFSPNGLSKVNDETEAIELLSSATHLTVYANDVLRDFYEEIYKGKEGFETQIQIDSSIAIESISSLLKSANLTYDPEHTKMFNDGGAVDASPQILIEVDDEAYIYILGNLFICAENKTYIPQRKDGDIDDDFRREITTILRQFVEGMKDNPNQRIDPTLKNAR